MKGRKILICTRDPGGTNAVMPLIKPLRALGNEVSVYGKDAALAIYRRLNIDCSDIRDAMPAVTQEDVSNFIRKARPDLVLTATSSEDFTERYLWKAAERSGIASFAVLDQWTNYQLRLIPDVKEGITERTASTELILPTFLFVMDDFARNEMAALGIDRERLVPAGQPFFDFIRKCGVMITASEIDRLRQEITDDQGGLVFVFASQPIASIHRQNGMAEDYWGYTEKTVLNSVILCLGRLSEESKAKVTLVIRLHPKDQQDDYKDLLEICSSSIRLVFDRDTDSSLLLKAADLIIGMFSMVLLEGAILGKRFISVQIGLKRENPLIFDRRGLMHSILTEEELEETLRGILKGERRPAPDLRFEFGATERIVEFLEGYK
jgi:hypothetical protein